jgi:hypothetical protein
LRAGIGAAAGASTRGVGVGNSVRRVSVVVAQPANAMASRTPKSRKVFGMKKVMDVV